MTDAELDALVQRLSSPTVYANRESDITILVAALRSERTQGQKFREKNDRQAYRLSQYQAEVETTRHNLTGCVAELERERTQNREAESLLRKGTWSVGTFVERREWLRSVHVLLTARDALSTQEAQQK